jgi:hypothetical protein
LKTQTLCWALTINLEKQNTSLGSD